MVNKTDLNLGVNFTYCCHLAERQYSWPPVCISTTLKVNVPGIQEVCLVFLSEQGGMFIYFRPISFRILRALSQQGNIIRRNTCR